MTRSRTLALAVASAVVVVLLAALVVPRLVAEEEDQEPASAPLSAPAPPAGAPVEGSYVRSEVADAERVVVSQWIASSRPVRELVVRAADPDGKPGTVEARDLVVLDGDHVLARREEVGTKAQRIRLDRPVQALYLRYTVFGGIEAAGSVEDRVLARVTALDTDGEAAGSVEDRVLARVTALDTDVEGAAGPVVREVRAAGAVTNLACLSRALPPAVRSCGASRAEGWRVELTGRDRQDRLMAQVDLR